jgi:hypothetical protein
MALRLRWLALGVGVLLMALAFAAATRVADTREGLIAEVVTLLSALAGISLVLYGMFARLVHAPRTSSRSVPGPPAPSVRPVRDLLVGGAGITLTVVLLVGLAASAGIQWAGLGAVLLLPMLAGSAYLVGRFVRAPERSWTLELGRSKTTREN